MFCLDALRKINNETPRLHEKTELEINNDMLRLKEALADVEELDEQIASVKALKSVKKDMVRQLELAERFYIYRKKDLLNLEGLIVRLNDYAKDRTALGEQYNDELLLLQGRLVAATAIQSDKVAREVEARMTYVSKQLETIAAETGEIKEALKQYSNDCAELACSLSLIEKEDMQKRK